MSSVLGSTDDWLEEQAKNPGGIIIELIVVFYCFCALAVLCEEHLAPALETLCVRWNVREDVAGATFLAFGSAAPEIVVNAVATIKSQINTNNNQASLGISAIIGSGLIAFGFIPAMCALFSDTELELKRRPLLRDEVFYTMALVTLTVSFRNGNIGVIESAVLVAIYFSYLLVVIFGRSIRGSYRQKVQGIPLPTRQLSFVHAAKEKRLSKTDRSLSKTPLLDKGHAKNISFTQLSIDYIKTDGDNNKTNSLHELASVISSSIVLEESRKVPNKLSREIGYIPSSDDYEETTAKKTSVDELLYEKHQIPTRGLPSVLYDSQLGESIDPLIFLARKRTLSMTKKRSTMTLNPINKNSTLLGKIFGIITFPLHTLFKLTCPAAGEGEKYEHLYAVTFFMSVVWITVSSYLLSSIVEAWVKAWDLPEILVGIILISVGAEIPDCIESVTMAMKGYGSMAVANCQGTQIINIGIGLGMPWLITNLTGNTLVVTNHSLLRIASYLLNGVVFLNVFLLLGIAMIQKRQKAQLTRWKGMSLITSYILAIFSFALYLYFQGEF